jgi:hypothetical protein
LLGATLAWFGAGDLERTRQFFEQLSKREPERAFYLGFGTSLAGLRGDYATVHRYLDEVRASFKPFGWEDAVEGYWLSVQGRHEEAAEAMRRAEPFPEHYGGPAGSSLLDGKQLLPAVLLTFRAIGRDAEADVLARKYTTMLQGQPDLDLAALAAAEGRKDLAVEALRIHVRDNRVLRYFQPSMPWFRSLEGHPGYAEVLAERQRRLDEMRAEMLKLETEARGTVLERR